MALFGKTQDKSELEALQQQLDAMEVRIATLEKHVATLEKQNEQAKTLLERLESRLNDEPAAAIGDAVDGPMLQGNTVVGLETGIKFADNEQPAVLQKTCIATTSYLAAPTADGFFAEESNDVQIGKTIYTLETDDGVNGRFAFFDTPDAIATATISVSQFVKSVCKVAGDARQMPRHIITEEVGLAVKESGGWRMVRKAVVRFE